MSSSEHLSVTIEVFILLSFVSDPHASVLSVSCQSLVVLFKADVSQDYDAFVHPLGEGLGSVESCASRWNSTLELAPQGSLLRSLCDNEMQEAAESGEAAGATLVLADQPIEETGRRITQLFALTLVELFTPWAGGWNRIGSDLQQAFGQALSWGEEGNGRGVGGGACSGGVGHL